MVVCAEQTGASFLTNEADLKLVIWKVQMETISSPASLVRLAVSVYTARTTIMQSESWSVWACPSVGAEIEEFIVETDVFVIATTHRKN